MDATNGRIVVGVDGSTASRHALEWAVEEARARKVPLEIVHAWQMVYAVEPMAGVGAMQFTPQELGAQAEATLDTMVEAGVPKDLGVDVTSTVAEGAAGRTLVERAADASLVVVGQHGHHPILSKLMGSVAEYVVHHADVPVVVVPSKD